MYLNSIQIIGFLGKDPERRQVRGNGVAYTVLSVATQRSWKNAQDEWQLEDRLAPRRIVEQSRRIRGTLARRRSRPGRRHACEQQLRARDRQRQESHDAKTYVMVDSR